MSMNLGKEMRFANYGRVKNIKEDGKFITFTLVTFRKWKNRNGEDVYVNSAWRAKAVGKAKEKIMGLEDKTRITLLSAYIENRVYEDKDSGKIRTWLELVVFDCDVDGARQAKKTDEEEKKKGDAPF